MPLSRVDETELLIPLYEGVYEEPRWRTLLDRLRRRTRSDFAGLLLTSGDPGDALEYSSGLHRWPMLRGLIDASGRSVAGELRPGRAYGAEEITAGRPSPPHTLGDRLPLRLVRTHRVDNLTALVAIAREKTEFGAADGALLTGLAVHLEAALLGLARLLAQQRSVELAEQALAAAGVGWVAFDGEARVVDFDPQCRQQFLGAIGRGPVRGERLQSSAAEGGRALAQACAAFSADPDSPSRLARLSDGPDMALIVRSARQSLFDGDRSVAAIGLLRVAAPDKRDRTDLVAKQHGLSRGEARLALALANGQSIVEAGAAQGLTPETARNYSKRLYAKTHARGQAELVARVLTSVAMLA